MGVSVRRGKGRPLMRHGGSSTRLYGFAELAFDEPDGRGRQYLLGLKVG
jgi:hypothetical protein